MKYLFVGLLILASGMLYFMHQSNKASAERLKQAEILHQQKLEQEKLMQRMPLNLLQKKRLKLN